MNFDAESLDPAGTLDSSAFVIHPLLRAVPRCSDSLPFFASFSALRVVPPMLRCCRSSATVTDPAFSGPVVIRDAEGAVTIRATRVTQPIALDGELNEEVYTWTPMIDGFLQQEPREGEPVTEATEVWLLFDDRNIYVAARLHDPEPEREVISEMRRDGQGTTTTRAWGGVRHVSRSAQWLSVPDQPGRGLFDGSITDERDMNRTGTPCGTLARGACPWLDGPDGHPVQVAPVPPAIRMGRQPQARCEAEERGTGPSPGFPPRLADEV